VRVLDKNPPNKHADFEKVDLIKQELATSYLKGYDLCICLAARSSGIRYFNEHPAEMLDENLKILSAVFNAVTDKDSPITKMVYISSSCVFDNADVQPVREESLESAPPPAAGYPFSKLVGEYYCRAFFRERGLPYTIIRPFNVYGPGESPTDNPGESHVIPDLTKKILDGRDPLEIFGDGQQTRSFTYVDDIAEGIISVIQCGDALNQDFNLACPEEISIATLAHKLWKLCKRKENTLRFKCLAPYPIDAQRRAVDISKATKILGWKPRVSLDEGLSRFVDWYKDHRRMDA
jgi:UDP-glucose 4-epimerase